MSWECKVLFVVWGLVPLASAVVSWGVARAVLGLLQVLGI